MLKDARTYEIMRPQDVGQTAEQLVLGRHSGRHAVQRRCETLGFTLTHDELAQVYQRGHHAWASTASRSATATCSRIVERVRTRRAHRARRVDASRSRRLRTRSLGQA